MVGIALQNLQREHLFDIDSVLARKSVVHNNTLNDAALMRQKIKDTLKEKTEELPF